MPNQRAACFTLPIPRLNRLLRSPALHVAYKLKLGKNVKASVQEGFIAGVYTNLKQWFSHCVQKKLKGKCLIVQNDEQKRQDCIIGGQGL